MWIKFKAIYEVNRKSAKLRFVAFKELTRIEQTLFGLPFVLAGALLSFDSAHKGHWASWLLLVPAFLLARISGMAFNQWIDWQIDSQNPRTQNRAIPSKRVTVKQAQVVAWGSLAAFLLLSFQVNALTAMLSLVAALLLFIYSYMKRIHASCHIVLGAIHFLGPVMAYGAFTGSLSLTSCFLGIAAALLIIGTDVSYAIQDFEFDRKKGLYSIPSRLGVDKSLSIAAWVHFVCPLMLFCAGLSAHFPIFYFLVVPIVWAFLFSFHLTLRKELRLKGVLQCGERPFFVCTVAVSFSSLLFISFSILWRVLS